MYREIHRVLKPGGRFVVSDVIAEEPLPDAVRSDPAAWAGCYGGAIPEDEYLGGDPRRRLRRRWRSSSGPSPTRRAECWSEA